MKIRVFTISVLLSMAFCQIFAQNAPSNANTTINRNSENTTFRSRIYLPFRKKPSKEQKRRLQPRAEDLAAYAHVLAEEQRAGIFRLLPDAGCEANALVVKANELCLNQIPESSFFSFREREHMQEVLSDIRLEKDHLITDGILSLGILVNLGDIAPENVTTQSEGLKFLNEFVPQSSRKEAYKQSQQIEKGVKFGGYEYKRTVPIVENSTYALRVIAYRGNILRSFRGFYFDLLAGDKRIDLTVALRIVRREPDGGVTIVWRELARRESPRVRFERK